MIRLRTLGTLDLRGSGGEEVRAVLAQPRRAALLAYLALATPRGTQRRDTVLTLFWPELDIDRARNALGQALHFLRRSIGADVIVNRNGEGLTIDWSKFWCDAAAFEGALDDQRVGEALALYRGDLLEGFHISEAPEFERWLDSGRARLIARYTTAVESVATEREGAGDFHGAATHWRALVARDPYNSRLTLRLMRALKAAGDPAGALAQAHRHERLLRDELGIAPAADVAAAVEQLHVGESTVARPAAIQGGVLRASTTARLVARGRQCVHAFTDDSYAEGARLLEEAVNGDPGHAEAHATLGLLYVALSQARDGSDWRSRGVEHCRIAARLNPTLAEPWCWLAWAGYLNETYDDADALAQRARQMDAKDHFAAYVLGTIRMSDGLRNAKWGSCQSAVDCFEETLVLNPWASHALLNLGSLYTISGQCDAACHYLRRAADLEQAPARENQLFGAVMLLGFVALQQGRNEVAREHFECATVTYRTKPQFFSPYVRAMALCGLGDIDRREGKYDCAVEKYLTARELLETEHVLVGSGYVMARLDFRLAAAYRRLWLRDEESRHAASGLDRVLNRRPGNFNWCWGVSEPELHYDRAVYHAACGDGAATLQALRDAAASGWGATGLLRHEPSFGFCLNDPLIASLSEQIGRRGVLRVAGSDQGASIPPGS